MSENNSQSLEIIMQLIMHGGDAKSSAMEAIQAAKKGDFSLAEDKLEHSQEAINEGHRVQTELLSKEAEGNEMDLNLLMVHAQDQLMSAMTYRDLAMEIIEIYNRID